MWQVRHEPLNYPSDSNMGALELFTASKCMAASRHISDFYEDHE